MMSEWLPDEIAEIVVDRKQIRKHVSDLGRRISEDYRGRELVMVGVLKGAAVFMSDLMREIIVPVHADFITVSSYGNNTETSGIVKILRDTDINIRGRDVLIVEDLIDSGLTLRYLKELYSMRAPSSLKLCTAFDKPSKRKTEVGVEYEGLIIPDKFVVGYGLDHAGKYRNLPDLCALKPEFYEVAQM